MASRWKLPGCGFVLTLAAVMLSGRPAVSADKIYFAIGPLIQSISVSSLEAFALEGELTGDLARYAPFIGETQLEAFKTVLTQPYEIDPLAVGNLAYTPLGNRFLERIGNIFQTESGSNGARAIRASLIATAQMPAGFTVLGFLQNFPTDLRINTREALFFMQALQAFQDYRAAALQAIADQSSQEAAAEAAGFDLGRLPDLSQPGPLSYQHQPLTVTAEGEGSQPPSFVADLYLPQLPAGAAALPVVVIAPSQGASAAEIRPLVAALASYGVAVAVAGMPEDEPALSLSPLENHLSASLKPADFRHRPAAISATLDRLAIWDAAAGNVALNLEQVGVVGTYLGGYAALAVAGAELDRQRLETVCSADGYGLNLSLFFQCQALETEPASFRDPRVAAVVAINPFSSTLLGPDAIAQIDIPVLIIGSSDDLLTPVTAEQIHPFLWLTSADKLLAIKVSSRQRPEAVSEGMLLPNPVDPETQALEAAYDQTLTLAFIQTHLTDERAYTPFLSAAYAQSTSAAPLSLLTLRSLTLDQLEAAYGGAAPSDSLPELRPR